MIIFRDPRDADSLERVAGNIGPGIFANGLDVTETICLALVAHAASHSPAAFRIGRATE